MARIKKIEIRDLVADKVIFEFKKENNTIKDTVVEAVKNKISLYNADLHGADLHGADLHDADLYRACLSGADLCGADLSDANLLKADLRCADLRCANLNRANLNCANLDCADLSDASLQRAYLCETDLCRAHLNGANLLQADLNRAYLGGTYLCDANLSNASLHCAYIRRADLSNVKLKHTDLHGADFTWVKNIPFIAYSCPSSGSFVGWKKIWAYEENYHGMFLVKLLIPEDARRCSATTDKCRCDKAKVLEIRSLETNENVDVITNTNFDDKHCTYKVGEMVYPDSFDENRWDECSHGIHFFINKQSAIDYLN